MNSNKNKRKNSVIDIDAAYLLGLCKIKVRKENEHDKTRK